MGGAQKNKGRRIYNGRGTQRVAEGHSATGKETGSSGEELGKDGGGDGNIGGGDQDHTYLRSGGRQALVKNKSATAASVARVPSSICTSNPTTSSHKTVDVRI
jgi:hypothetical protein